MGSKRQHGKCESRAEVVERVERLLAEHFDAGVGMVSWAEEGETQYLTLKFGNSFAVEGMSEQLPMCLEVRGEGEDEDEDD
jgi:hypothetical protein